MEYTENFEYRGFNILIPYDDMAPDPRKDDEGLFSQMICFHKDYSLGDRHGFVSPEHLAEYLKELELDNELVIKKPLYLYDHGNITMRTWPFSCRFDSGQVGIIFVEEDDLPYFLSDWKYNTETQEKIERMIEAEVKLYDAYISGNVFGFIVQDENGENVDSCWGFYGMEGMEEAIEEAKAVIDYTIREREEKIGRNKERFEIAKKYASPIADLNNIYEQIKE